MTEYAPEKVAEARKGLDQLHRYSFGDNSEIDRTYVSVLAERISDALTAVSAERDRLHKAITEALDAVESSGVIWGDELRINAEGLLGILRAALDKEGNDDE